MPGWKDALQNNVLDSVHSAEKEFDRLKRAFQVRLGLMDPVMVLPFRSYGTRQWFWLKGRVLEDEGVDPLEDRDTVWDNMLASYKRFESDEIPGVRVRARYGMHEAVAVTNEEGYFDLQLAVALPHDDDALWHEVELELLDPIDEDKDEVKATGMVQVPSPSADFGIISDVDDTVIRTGATNFLNMARLTFLDNARTRAPFEGVAALYRALQHGPDRVGHNPVFYVSSSPWNLYDLLTDFCDLHGVPIGPFLLRDLGIDDNKFIKSGHHEHKLRQVRRIFETYPDLSFALIGDSGQQDPEIYREVTREYPERVRAVYIRDVSPEARDADVRTIAEEVRENGIPFVLTQNSISAAEHAAEHGLIAPEAVRDIRREIEKNDSGTTTA